VVTVSAVHPAPVLADEPELARFLDGQPRLSEHKWIDLTHGPQGDTVGFRAHDRELVGYAHASAHGPVWGVELATAPRYEEALLRGVLGELSGTGRAVHWWVHGAEPRHDELAARLGLRLDRELLQMHVALPVAPPAWPAGIRVADFRPGVDDAAWLAVNAASFADHAEQGRVDQAQLDARKAEPWFDPAGFLLAWDSRGLAGSCWTKIHGTGDPTDAGREGEIYAIGVAPDRQGTGLGRALTLGGLERIHARGITTGMLYVDGANTGAVRLYESIGFRVTARHRTYVT
jgi:mycothiol synthase